MALVHGRAISSEEVESIVSREFTAREFASLCNAVAWATAGHVCSSVPSFTERVNVRDKGIDAEWNIELCADHEYASPLLGPGWNVFQYKQRDVFAQGRDRTYTNLKAGLRGAIRSLRDDAGRQPQRYVLFTNLDLSHEQKTALRPAVLKRLMHIERVKLE